MFILASASSARLRLLRQAGLEPHVLVSGVDEPAEVEALADPTPAEVALHLAEVKARAVVGTLPGTPAVVLACDSVFEFDGQALGKPHDIDQARERWNRMQGGVGVLHTGHCLIRITEATDASTAHIEVRELVSTTVHMGHADADEMEYYLDSGEPLQVAGGFTLDGLGAPFIAGVDGDPGNVIGVSLPAVRRLARAAGLTWPQLVALAGER